MAKYENLLPGDPVDWIRQLSHCEELVAAVVYYKTPQKIAIRFEHDGKEIVKFVDASRLRPRFGGVMRRQRFPEPKAKPQECAMQRKGESTMAKKKKAAPKKLAKKASKKKSKK